VVEDLKWEARMDDELALDVGYHGASRRARPTPSFVALVGKVLVEEEQRAPILRDHRAKANGSSTKPFRVDTSYDEEKEDLKLMEYQDESHIVGVGRRRGASQRAQSATAIATQEAKIEEGQRVRPLSHVVAASN
jgi:hypothetical protein